MVINPPPDVVRPGVGAVGPPRIMSGFGIEMAKGVNVSSFEELCHGLALLGKITGALLIVLGTRQVYLRVCDVVVAAENDVLARFDELVAESFDRIAEFQFVLNPFSLGLTIREIAVHDREIFELDGLHPALIVEFLLAEGLDGKRLLLGVGRYPAISFLLRWMPDGGIAFRFALGIGEIRRQHTAFL